MIIVPEPGAAAREPAAEAPGAAAADYLVFTPERVTLNYDIAGIGSRAAAALVDAAIQGVAMVLVYLAVTLTAGMRLVANPRSGLAIAGGVVGGDSASVGDGNRREGHGARRRTYRP